MHCIPVRLATLSDDRNNFISAYISDVAVELAMQLRLCGNSIALAVCGPTWQPVMQVAADISLYFYVKDQIYYQCSH